MNRSSAQVFPWPPVLTLIFVVLKLTGNIGWSWWWVLSPMWITLLVALVLFAVAVLVAAIKG